MNLLLLRSQPLFATFLIAAKHNTLDPAVIVKCMFLETREFDIVMSGQFCTLQTIQWEQGHSKGVKTVNLTYLWNNYFHCHPPLKVLKDISRACIMCGEPWYVIRVGVEFIEI